MTMHSVLETESVGEANNILTAVKGPQLLTIPLFDEQKRRLRIVTLVFPDDLASEQQKRLLPKGVKELFAVVQQIADFGVDVEVEAGLHAGVAAAEFGIQRYLAVLMDAKKSSLALKLLADAKNGCRRSIDQLRLRIARAIAHLCRLMDGEDFMEVGRLVVSISA